MDRLTRAAGTARQNNSPQVARLGCTHRVIGLRQSSDENEAASTFKFSRRNCSPVRGRLHRSFSTAGRKSLHKPINSGACPTPKDFPCALAMLMTVSAAESESQRNTVVTPRRISNTTAAGDLQAHGALPQSAASAGGLSPSPRLSRALLFQRLSVPRCEGAASQAAWHFLPETGLAVLRALLGRIFVRQA
jgi:hypothetical protein